MKRDRHIVNIVKSQSIVDVKGNNILILPGQYFCKLACLETPKTYHLRNSGMGNKRLQLTKRYSIALYLWSNSQCNSFSYIITKSMPAL